MRCAVKMGRPFRASLWPGFHPGRCPGLVWLRPLAFSPEHRFQLTEGHTVRVPSNRITIPLAAFSSASIRSSVTAGSS